MTTFSDMMTLLLVFFVLLYSMSNIDAKKFRQFISDFQGNPGVLTGGKTISDSELINAGDMGKNFNQLKIIAQNLNNFIDMNGLDKQVDVKVTENGLYIKLTGEILYDLGRAKIKPTGKKILDEVSSSIKGMPNKIEVEGHTDDLPIDNNNYPSNWELSTARAVRVIKFFIENHNIKADRLSASGYSQYQPIVKNNNKKNREKNRRVEILIKKLEEK